MTGPPVVLVGLDCPTGLQAARVFASRGVEVVGVAADPRHPCALTRTCRRVVPAAPGPGGVVVTLRDLSTTLDGEAVLLPCTDQAVLAIARHQRELSDRYRMAAPSRSVIELLLDKARFTGFATRHGFPIPITRVVRTRADAEAASRAVDYPCVLKPSVKSAAWTRNTSAKALLADSPGRLLELYDRHAPWADAFVMQRWIHGSDPDHYTCDCYLRADGEPLVTFSTRKLRQWPPEVGQGCISVEHRNDVVRELALRVLKAAGYHGLGYVEMKYDAREERHFIVEANVGRPTGRSAAAEKAGVELLMTMYCDVIGAPLPTARTQRFRGSKWIHVRRDLQACSRLLVTRRARPGEILRSWSGSFAFALFSLRDPRPFLADMTRGMGRALRFRRASRGADGSLPGVFARTGVRGAPEVRPPPRDRSRIAPAAPTGAPPASIDERNAPPDEPASVPSHRIRETG